MNQESLMIYSPSGGINQPYPPHAAQWRKHHGNVAWVINPWTGENRDPRDIGSDPFGLLIAPPGEELVASQPAPGAEVGGDEAVAYLDIGAGGYMDLDSELSSDQLAALPAGRHMLGIIGTYGVEGYKAARAQLTEGADVIAAARRVVGWLDWSGGLPVVGGESMTRDLMALRDAIRGKAALTAAGGRDELVPLAWSVQQEPTQGDIPYHNVTAQTPFGRIVISWKGWKETPAYTIDEHPVPTANYQTHYSLNDAKEAAEAAMVVAVASLAAPQPAQEVD